MKDWGISRQRYWGCPIPIAYDDKNNIFKIPENELPVKLPEKININTNGNPLIHPMTGNLLQLMEKNILEKQTHLTLL